MSHVGGEILESGSVGVVMLETNYFSDNPTHTLSTFGDASG
jgi:hypothetical protein